MQKTITNYNEVMNTLFDTMDINNDSFEQFYDQVYTTLSESGSFSNKVYSEYMEEYKEYKEEQFDEYFQEALSDYFEGVYVVYNVTGKLLDSLDSDLLTDLGIFWSDSLDSYIFLQYWYGMSASMIKVNPFTINTIE